MSEFDQFAKSWHQPDGPMEALHRIHPIRMAFIEEFLPEKPIKILDAGCAGGLIALDLAAQGHQVTGVDLSNDLIEQARIKANEKDLNIQWISDSLESFTPQDNFDMVICSEVLEHIAEPMKVLSRLTSFLNPGGILIISTINRTLLGFLTAIVGAEYILNLVPKGTHRFNDLINSAQLIQSIEREGLSLKRLSGIGYNPLSKKAKLVRDTSVNYILAAENSSL